MVAVVAGACCSLVQAARWWQLYGGTPVPTALLLATAVPVAMSTAATAAQTMPKATLMISFVKLNTLIN